MYAHIDGILCENNGDTLVIDCGGVGYELNVSRNTAANAPHIGEQMKCYTILSVREDAMELFGFATKEEKQLFRKLVSVNGVGARTALGILSTVPVRELSIAIITGDIKTLSRAPGVGKKTAQRIALELKEKMDNAELDAGLNVSDLGGLDIEGSITQDAADALEALGYSASEARLAVARAAQDGTCTTAEALISRALRGMDKE